MKTILVTGANGQVGWELQRTLAPMGRVIALDRQAMDLADPDRIRAVLRAAKPEIIVNGAAYTAVDRAEQEPELAAKINGQAPGIMAEEARRLKAALIHYSTDYVFDGRKTSPYTEADHPNPLGVYGRTKLAGEEAIRAVGGSFLILRTSWVYGLRGTNFLRTILRLAREREELKVVDDQVGSPTWSRMLAQTTAQILARHQEDTPARLAELAGVYHLAAGGRTTWYGFARAILDKTADLPGRKLVRLHPIPTAEYPTPARRPAFSLLACDRLRDRFKINTPEWETALDLALGDYR